MRPRHHRATVTALLAAGTLVLPLSAGAGAATGNHHEDRPLAGMRILLSNDDSMQMARPNASDGKGLYEVRRALCSAGADVVVMAPWANQSGAGTSAAGSGTLTVRRRTVLPAEYGRDCADAPTGGAVYGVCKGAVACDAGSVSATPVDTVRLALNGGLAAKAGWTKGPDLVVTGSNYGPNVASVVNDSGTVGAALAAIEEGTPAVALNSSYDPTVTASFEVADRTYRQTAAFGAAFIASLRDRRLLTTDYVVNVNYPHLAEGRQPRGTVWSSVGTQKLIQPGYAQADPNSDTFTVGGALCAAGNPKCRPETKRDADYRLLQQGNVTVTPITPDRTFEGREAGRLERFVRTGR
ncbi:5'/3'-nucleotidase SurE [Streptomyces sp. H39-S7]|uniref:5'/3'-nucleotidase SurE n=1 Tax=Streptomyces sp. H39-S7 TaxID=3004357 RepID=UPI0022B0632B|nr:5'/3'-nucleotidase SurE [Streptomyces sp. H39-S7]MCZ4123326.1 5'/3'-nucleotidase SurE [Streptomyces sp. H39-S7]